MLGWTIYPCNPLAAPGNDLYLHVRSFSWGQGGVGGRGSLCLTLDPLRSTWSRLLVVCCRRSFPRTQSTESRSEDNPYDFRHLLRKTSQRRKLIKHYWAAAAELCPVGLAACTDGNISRFSVANITSRTESTVDFRTHQIQLEVLNEPFSEVVQMFSVTLSQNNFTIYLLFFKYI